MQDWEMHADAFSAPAVRFAITVGGEEIGHAYAYVLSNDIHKQPFALLEDVFVAEGYRNRGVGTALVERVIRHARGAGCYKIIATSRTDGTREHVHAWYRRLGFRQHGAEFRLEYPELSGPT